MSVDQKERIEKWNKVSQDVLKGRTIVDVRYLNDEEMGDIGWSSRPIVFFLDNGTYCTLSSDDEGNDGGVLFYNENGVLPTL
jgi:hypothetical protein